MTREEATEILENKENYVGIQHIPGADVYISRDLVEAINVALSALRPVSREQIEKMRREFLITSTSAGEKGELLIDHAECSKCGYEPIVISHFCPNCGAPMTDEAVEMVMERLEALNDAVSTTT